MPNLTAAPLPRPLPNIPVVLATAEAEIHEAAVRTVVGLAVVANGEPGAAREAVVCDAAELDDDAIQRLIARRSALIIEHPWALTDDLVEPARAAGLHILPIRGSAFELGIRRLAALAVGGYLGSLERVLYTPDQRGRLHRTECLFHALCVVEAVTAATVQRLEFAPASGGDAWLDNGLVARIDPTAEAQAPCYRVTVEGTKGRAELSGDGSLRVSTPGRVRDERFWSDPVGRYARFYSAVRTLLDERPDHRDIADALRVVRLIANSNVGASAATQAAGAATRGKGA